MVLRDIVAAIIGYLFGSISSAVILSKIIIKKDVRRYGSGNAGATNIARVFGMGAGALILCSDIIKTVLALIIGRIIGGENGFIFAAIGCMVGHCLPVFFEFKGGKGVSIGAAIGLMIDIRLFLILVVIFIAVFVFTHRVSAGSVSCAVLFPVITLLLGCGINMVLLGLFVTVSVVFMHRENIVRLINGTEPVFKAKK